MLRRAFGDTNLEVSAISLGCWIFGVDWWGHYTDERAIDAGRRADDGRFRWDGSRDRSGTL